MGSKFIAGIIIVSAVVLAIFSVWNDSPIVDEIPHIGAGYSYVQKGDFRLNPEHPPLAKDLAGFALGFLSLNQSAFKTQFWATDINGQWNFGRNLIFNSGNDAILITRVAKLPMILFFIFSAIIIFHWARKLYGDKAAILATFLFSFSPTVVAHSRFVTTDIPALFGILLATYFYVRFLEYQSRKNLIIASLAFGIAQLTKFSVFLLNPMFIVVAIAWGLKSHHEKIIETSRTFFKTIFIIIAGYIFIVWPIYGLHAFNYPPELQKRDTIYHLGSYGNRLIADRVVWASDKPYIRALGQYGLGVLMVTQRAIGGNNTYFLGEISNHAWKKYFPIVYFIKEPLPFWGLFIIAVLFAVWQFRFNKYKISHLLDKNFHQFVMLLWIAIYWYSSVKANLNIGVRHLLPTYGFVFILVSGQMIELGRKLWQTYGKKTHRFYDVLIYILLAWYLLENLLVFPYYLTYFNQIAGGPKGGYRYVVDSNVDWGQDAKRLADWVDKNKISKISLDYFGWADAGYYLGNKYIWINAGKYKNAREFLLDNPEGGYIAVSKSFFMGSRKIRQLADETSYAWLDSYQPVADIGNSIFVWKITQ